MNTARRVVVILALIISGPAAAHDMGSVYLTVDQGPDGRVSFAMKSTIGRDGRAAAVSAVLEPACQPVGTPQAERTDGVVLRQWTVTCRGGAAGRVVRVSGLDAATPDAFVELRSGGVTTSRHGLSRHNATVAISPDNARPPTAHYLRIGVEHIIFGLDHLLFVLGLLMLWRCTGGSVGRLVGLVTAFTAAHSVTLGGAMLAGWSVPSALVETLIALSIAVLAVEIIEHPRRASAGWPPTLTARWPWVVAFGCGLLHGFGFAGSLAQLGIPQDSAVRALLLFNLGVEAGQLAIVACALGIGMALGRAHADAWVRWRGVASTVAVNSMGGIAMFWVLQRSVPIVTGGMQ